MTKAEIIEQVKATTALVMGLEPSDLKEEFHFMHDLGTDSLAMIQIKVELEDVYDMDIPDEHISRITTIESTGDYLFERFQEQ